MHSIVGLFSPSTKLCRISWVQGNMKNGVCDRNRDKSSGKYETSKFNRINTHGLIHCSTKMVISITSKCWQNLIFNVVWRDFHTTSTFYDMVQGRISRTFSYFGKNALEFRFIQFGELNLRGKHWVCCIAFLYGYAH